MSLWVESNSIKEAKRAGTYLCSYRCSKPILGGGLYRLPLQEVFLEKSHAWKTYNENRMWISDKDTDLRVIFNNEKSDDSPFRTRLSWKTCKYKHFKSVDILGREQIKPNDTLQFFVDFYLYRNGDDRLICTDSVLFYPYVE